MRTKLVVLTLMVTAAVSLFAQPKIQIVGGNKFDFGDVYRGKIMERTVVVRNTGREMLELGQVNVSCGCTGTVVSNNSIPPGKTGEIKITFNSTNFSGKIHKSVTINSNAADAPQTTIEFEGNVIQELAVTPQQFWFQNAEVGRASYAKISITNNSTEPISLTSYESRCQGFTLILPKHPVKPGETVELTAELKAKSATQVLNDGVSIKTSSKNEPNVFVRIFGAVKEFKFQ